MEIENAKSNMTTEFKPGQWNVDNDDELNEATRNVGQWGEAFKTMDLEPTAMDVEPTAMDLEPTVIEVEPNPMDQEPSKVAIIIPFREQVGENIRETQLRELAEHMKIAMDLVMKEGDEYKIYVIKQTHEKRNPDRFNRGILLNYGFEKAKENGSNIFIFHDVDLLPDVNVELMKFYVKHPKRPIHIAKCWKGRYEYNYKTGGIFSISQTDFEKANGYPNNFYGWGGEDDELALRLEKENKVLIVDPSKIISHENCKIKDLENFSWEEKKKFLDQDVTKLKNMLKRERLSEHDKTWKTNGLNNLDELVELVDTEIIEDENIIEYTIRIEMESPLLVQEERNTKTKLMDESTKKMTFAQRQQELRKQDKLLPIYSECLNSKTVVLELNLIGTTEMKEMLRLVIAKMIEGKCSVEGYVKPNSVDILTYSSGMIERGNSVSFTVVYKCEVCFPVQGMKLNCVVKNVTKAGIRAELPTKEPSPIVVFIARDHFAQSREFNNVKVNDQIHVTVIGQRFELNDNYISVIGSFGNKDTSFF